MTEPSRVHRFPLLQIRGNTFQLFTIKLKLFRKLLEFVGFLTEKATIIKRETNIK